MLQNLLDQLNYAPRDLSQVLEQNRKLDQFFGISPELIEKQLNDYDGHEQLYLDIDCEALSTSYYDFAQIFRALQLEPGDTFVDLGAGFGRSVLLLSQLYPKVMGIGIEYLKERIAPGLSFLEKHGSMLLAQDLMGKDYKIPQADAYFLYLPQGPLSDRILEQLRQIACYHRIQIAVIESHGDLLDRIRDEKFLKLKTSMKTASPRHDPEIYIFESLAPGECQEIDRKDQQLLRQSLRLRSISLLDIEPSFIARHLNSFRGYIAQIEVSLVNGGTRTWYASLAKSSLSYYRGQVYLEFESGSLASFGELWNTKLIRLIAKSCLSLKDVELR